MALTAAELFEEMSGKVGGAGSVQPRQELVWYGVDGGAPWLDRLPIVTESGVEVDAAGPGRDPGSRFGCGSPASPDVREHPAWWPRRP